MTIKNLVISGGGLNGLIFLGIIKKLLDDKYLDLNNIKTIYGASIGSLIGVILCLKLDYNDIINYFIERPWHKVINKLDLNSSSLINFFSDKGLIDDKLIKIIFSNLLKAVDLDEDITFLDLYKYSNKHLIISSVNVNTFTLDEFSYKKTPHMKIIDGIYCSSSLPLIFKPKYINGSYYIDSGLIKNYPDEQILKYGNIDETFGIAVLTPLNEIQINQDDDIFKFVYKLLHKLLINFTREQVKVLKHEIRFEHVSSFSNEKTYDFFSNKEYRKEILEKGIKKAKLYLMSLNNSV
tara:strand:- start:23843 stop:24724 length:882 start_codon:yes stop_codon:yes gene_type:complete